MEIEKRKRRAETRQNEDTYIHTHRKQELLITWRNRDTRTRRTQKPGEWTCKHRIRGRQGHDENGTREGVQEKK